MYTGDTIPTPPPQLSWTLYSLAGSPRHLHVHGGGRGNGYHSGAGILGLWVLNCQKKSSIVSPAPGHIITLIPKKGRAADALLKGF